MLQTVLAKEGVVNETIIDIIYHVKRHRDSVRYISYHDFDGDICINAR